MKELDKKGYYISPLYNLVVFYGDSFDVYNRITELFENIELTEGAVESLNYVFEYDFIGEL